MSFSPSIAKSKVHTSISTKRANDFRPD